MLLQYTEVENKYQPAFLKKDDVKEFVNLMKRGDNPISLTNKIEKNEDKNISKFGFYQVLVDIIANKTILKDIIDYIYQLNYDYKTAEEGKKIVIEAMLYIHKTCNNQLYRDDAIKIRNNLIIFVKENKVK
jgi:hypothetical protein